MLTRRLFSPAYRHSGLLCEEELHVLVFLWSAWRTLDLGVPMCGGLHCTFNGELSYNMMFQQKSCDAVLGYLGITTMWDESISRISRRTRISVGEIGRNDVSLFWMEPLKVIEIRFNTTKVFQLKKIMSCSPVAELSIEINGSWKREGSARIKLPTCPSEAPNSVSLQVTMELLNKGWEACSADQYLCVWMQMQISAVAVYLLQAPLRNLHSAGVKFSKGLDFWE